MGEHEARREAEAVKDLIERGERLANAAQSVLEHGGGIPVALRETLGHYVREWRRFSEHERAPELDLRGGVLR